MSITEDNCFCSAMLSLEGQKFAEVSLYGKFTKLVDSLFAGESELESRGKKRKKI